jgi:hypothetical protein
MGQSPLDEFDQAMGSFVRGDANAAASLWLPAEDVTIFGAFGGYERGWAAVRPRLAWAASQFRDGTWACEHLAAHFGADVGYTVGIEHERASIGGAPCRPARRLTSYYRCVARAPRLAPAPCAPLCAAASPSTSRPT